MKKNNAPSTARGTSARATAGLASMRRQPQGVSMRLFKRVRSVVSLLVGVSLGVGAVHSAEPVKIRVAWQTPISTWGSVLLEKRDLAKHLGKSYALEPVRFVGTPPMITALANNELEVADLAFSTIPLAIQNAGMEDLRIIADEYEDGVPGHYSNEFMVLIDSP